MGERIGVLGGRRVCGRSGALRGRVAVNCVVYGRYLKGAVVRSISCSAPLKVSRLLEVDALDGSLFRGVDGWILFGCVWA